MHMYTTALIVVISIFIIIAILVGINIMLKKPEITEDEYKEMKTKARSMMTRVDPLTGLPYSTMETPSHVEYLDERFTIKNENEDEQGQDKDAE